MKPVTLHQRVKRLRVALRETQTVFAARFGVDQSTIAKWESSRSAQIPTQDKMDLIADLEDELGLSTEAGEEINSDGGSLFTLVPVVGEIGAGAAVYPVEGDASTKATGYVKAARGFGAVEALRVRGDSMWPAYRDGDWVFIENRPAEFPLSRGREYILELADGSLLLKMVEPAEAGLYNLISYNAPPVSGVRIVSARRVRYVRKA